MANLPRTMSLKKLILPTPSSHQLSVDPQLGVGARIQVPTVLECQLV